MSSRARPTLKAAVKRSLVRAATPFQRCLLGPLNAARYRRRPRRRLELGPGGRRLPGFETLDVAPGRHVDYVGDASKRLPFADGVFDLVYASHILEHVAWYDAVATLREWRRILKPGGGRLEVWVPDGLKIAEAFVAAEKAGARDFEADGWWRFNEARDPCVWACGRVFSYGDGLGTRGHVNWHRALYSERRLRDVLLEAGFVNVERLDRAQVRGHDHGWINLGMRGERA